jgi:hypothetical protein
MNDILTKIDDDARKIKNSMSKDKKSFCLRWQTGVALTIFFSLFSGGIVALVTENEEKATPVHKKVLKSSHIDFSKSQESHLLQASNIPETNISRAKVYISLDDNSG